MKLRTNYDFIIIGAGTVGMACAIALAQREYSVLLLDNKPAPSADDFAKRLAQRDARVYALNTASIALFDAVGVWQNMTRRADYTAMQVWAKDGRGELKFGGDDVLHPSILGSMVEPSVIDHALWQKSLMLSDHLHIGYGAQLLGDGMAFDVLSDGVMVRFVMDNQSYAARASIVLGADGRGSMVRTTLGIELARLDYHQTAICCAIHTDKPHGQTARQAMLPTGTLALLPLADLHADDGGHWQSVVWTLPSALAYDYLDKFKQDPQFLLHELEQASGFELGAISQVESVASFPLSAQMAARYHIGRVGLMGDAAHGVHPLAGQGLNLGLADVIALLDSVDKYKHQHRKLDARLLHDYERAVKGYNALMMHSFSMINFAFASGVADLHSFGFVRSEVMNLLSKNRAAMAFFEQHANGQG
ncbi:FAD-dependent monooxygenase [Moraxella sp. FZFQ2102]|uniref:FAD-dependent monooxygenase n=1 Tax=Moraxella sp. FZFQ2102 TaxID=2953752 RepID=UPI00209BEA5A|nr:FAD-dependent monooxygenase [Moraxella sp. FZFQ2102]USZ14922.1 FAD-dependent monooxygenase [Moraxella sp. FZFQ2102]